MYNKLWKDEMYQELRGFCFYNTVMEARVHVAGTSWSYHIYVNFYNVVQKVQSEKSSTFL